MNCPEKIAGAYLRLNGFFVLPHFTLFNGRQHTHVDFLALRPPGGRERCGGQELPLDQEFFAMADRLTRGNSLDKLIGAIVEIKGGNVGELPSARHRGYAKEFFGPEATIISLSFSQEIADIAMARDTIVISVMHSLKWITQRIDWMNNNVHSLSKTGSWTWSEEFLSDLLYLHGLEVPRPTPRRRR